MADLTFRTIRLRDEESSLEATFVPDAGMICCSLRHRGEELLAQNAGVRAYAELGKTMGIPLLYPWANRLAGFDFSVAGRTAAVPHDPARIALDGNGLPIHGVIGGRQRWELLAAPGQDGPESKDEPGSKSEFESGSESRSKVESGPKSESWSKFESVSKAESGSKAESSSRSKSGPGPGSQSLTARLSWSESQPELFEVFPFRHDLQYEARLADDRLTVTITVDACGTDTVPVAFGLHPYLSPPGVPRERYLVELPPMRRLALDADQIPVGPERESPGRRFELASGEFDDGFDMVPEPARFSVEAGERWIALELIEGYPCAQVYAPHGGQFICFEPMTAPANALRSGNGLRLLSPGERYRATFVLSVQDLTPTG